MNRQKLIELQRDLMGVDNLSNDYDRVSSKSILKEKYFLFEILAIHSRRLSPEILSERLSTTNVFLGKSREKLERRDSLVLVLKSEVGM